MRIARRPTLWVELGVALIWLALIGEMLIGHPGAATGAAFGGGGAAWVCSTGLGGAGDAGQHLPTIATAGPASSAALLSMLAMPALMAAAMMIPTAMPAVRHVAVNSLYWRRRRATVEFLAAYLAVWVAFSLAALGGLGLLAAGAPPLTGAALLALAALWQLSPAKRRALRACHRARPLPPRGWRATAGTAGFGLRNGGACLLSCWPMMLTTAFVAWPRLLWMAALTALIWAEKINLKPRRAARRVGLGLAAAALLAAIPALA